MIVDTSTQLHLLSLFVPHSKLTLQIAFYAFLPYCSGLEHLSGYLCKSHNSLALHPYTSIQLPLLSHSALHPPRSTQTLASLPSSPFILNRLTLHKLIAPIQRFINHCGPASKARAFSPIITSFFASFSHTSPYSHPVSTFCLNKSSASKLLG